MEKTFDTPGTLALELRLPSGEILVETADTTETHVELTASNEAGEELIRDSRIELRDGGGRQVVFVEVPERKGWGITWGRGPEVRIRVRCPHGAGLEVATASADVSARGRFGGTGVKTASGDVEIEHAGNGAVIKTASGDVTIESVAGAADVHTVSGDQQLEQVDGIATLRSVSGDIEVRDARGDVHSNSVSGDHQFDAVAGDVQAQSVSGDVRIGVRRGLRVHVDATTVSGSMSSELDLDNAAPASEGRVIEIRAKTVSGDVRIVRAAALPDSPSDLTAQEVQA